ncbi:MAG: hypothetical protein FWH05_09300 [Oscillospiraceae bacterium]|nr:hypothetical protein [Oscillospiraceae bacterium]
MDITKNLLGGLDSITDWLSDKLNNILAVVLQLLPDSPFSVELPAEVKNILGYINWLIPFGQITATLGFWVAAVGVYYAYKVILRWAKAI